MFGVELLIAFALVCVIAVLIMAVRCPDQPHRGMPRCSNKRGLGGD